MTSSPGRLTGTVLGRYRVGALLGRGGMGEVYRAEDSELQRPVALKVLPEAVTGDPDRLARFVQEARTASSLNHPHLVAIYEVGETHVGGVPVHFIAMELVQGESLRHMLEGRRAGLKRLLDYFAQAADALAAAHAAGVVHRDLKPENIMIADGGYAKVLDFGVAKLQASRVAPGSDDDVTRTINGPATTPGLVVGTVGYMSPEQAQGLPVDPRSDIFSFGCMLYEAATGTRPFSGASTIDTLHRIIHEQPSPASLVAPATPAELSRIIRKCLAKSPEDRYQTMRDVAIDLRELRHDLDSGSSPSVSAHATSEGFRTRTRRLMLVTAVVLCTAAAAAFWMARRASPVERAPLTIERVTTSGNVIDAVISSDGKYLAYVESAGGAQSLWYRQVNGSQPLQLVSPRGGFWGIALSPDGTSIYYALKSAEDPRGSLFSIPVLGGTPRRLLTGIDSAVTFSPDGARLAYLRVERDGSSASSLVVSDVEGRDPRPLVTKRPPEFFAPTFFVAPSWSPDGAHIATPVRYADAQYVGLSLFGAADGAERRFSSKYVEAAYTRWLPDGSGVLFVAREHGTYGTGNGGQIWLQPYPSGDVRRVTNDLIEYRTISVSADMTQLLTVGFEANAQLWTGDGSGNGAQRLSDERSAGIGGLAWSPDGRRIFYMKALARELRIWSMQSDGTGARELVRDARPAGIAVPPEEDVIVYAARRTDADGIWRSRTDGSSAVLLAGVIGPEHLAISPDGRTVYFTAAIDGPQSTYRLPLEGGTPAMVTRLLTRAAPSPDGTLLAGVYRASDDAPISIGIVNASDGRPVQVFPDYAPPGMTNFGWSADGKSLIFATTERTNLWTQPAAGGPREKLTQFTDQFVVRFALSPDGRRMVLARGTALRDAVLISNFR